MESTGDQFLEEQRLGEIPFAKVGRNSLLFAAGAIAGKIVGFLMLPIVTRALTPEQYGQADVLTTLGSALITTLLLGLDVAAIRLSVVPGRQSQVFGTWYAMAGVIVAPAAIALVLAAPYVSAALFATTDLTEAVALVAAVLFFGTFQVVALGVLRARGRAAAFALLSAGSLVLTAGMTLLLLAIGATVVAVIGGLAVSLLLSSLCGFALVRSDALWRFNRSMAREMLQLGLPLAPGVVAVWVGDLGHRLILLSQAGTEQVAYFAVALRLASLAGLVLIGLQLAWQPRAYALGTGPEAEARVSMEAQGIVLAVAAAATLAAFAAVEVIDVLGGRQYEKSIATAGPALMIVVLQALFVVCSTAAISVRAPGLVTSLTIVGIIVAVVANLALAAQFGSRGTASALAAGQGVAAVLALWLCRHRLGFRLEMGAAIPVSLAAVAVIAAVTMPSPPLPLPVRLFIAIGFTAVLVRDRSMQQMIGELRAGFRQ